MRPRCIQKRDITGPIPSGNGRPASYHDSNRICFGCESGSNTTSHQDKPSDSRARVSQLVRIVRNARAFGIVANPARPKILFHAHRGGVHRQAIPHRRSRGAVQLRPRHHELRQSKESVIGHHEQHHQFILRDLVVAVAIERPEIESGLCNQLHAFGRERGVGIRGAVRIEIRAPTGRDARCQPEMPALVKLNLS
jgi:hypothetical protein